MSCHMNPGKPSLLRFAHARSAEPWLHLARGIHSDTCSWAHRRSQASSKGAQWGPRLDTFARGLTLPVSQTTHVWMDSIDTHAAEHTGEVRLLARVSRGAPDWTPLLEAWLRRCAQLHVCRWKPLTRWSQASAELTWTDLRSDDFPGYMQPNTSAEAQPLDVMDQMLLAWCVRLWCILRRHICLDSGGCVCVWGVSVCGPIQKWQTGTQGGTFLVDWNWLVGEGLESSQQDCLGKTGRRDRQTQLGEMVWHVWLNPPGQSRLALCPKDLGRNS